MASCLYPYIRQNGSESYYVHAIDEQFSCLSQPFTSQTFYTPRKKAGHKYAPARALLWPEQLGGVSFKMFDDSNNFSC